MDVGGANGSTIRQGTERLLKQGAEDVVRDGANVAYASREPNRLRWLDDRAEGVEEVGLIAPVGLGNDLGYVVVGARYDLVVLHVAYLLEPAVKTEADVVRGCARPTALAAHGVVVAVALHHRVLEREAGPIKRALAERYDGMASAGGSRVICQFHDSFPGHVGDRLAVSLSELPDLTWEEFEEASALATHDLTAT